MFFSSWSAAQTGSTRLRGRIESEPLLGRRRKDGERLCLSVTLFKFNAASVSRWNSRSNWINLPLPLYYHFAARLGPNLSCRASPSFGGCVREGNRMWGEIRQIIGRRKNDFWLCANISIYASANFPLCEKWTFTIRFSFILVIAKTGRDGRLYYLCMTIT